MRQQRVEKHCFSTLVMYPPENQESIFLSFDFRGLLTDICSRLPVVFGLLQLQFKQSAVPPLLHTIAAGL